MLKRPSQCECGCGQATPLSTRTRKERGQVRGQPVRFIRGHSGHKFQLGENGGAIGDKHGMYRHGMTNTPEHKAYETAQQRCNNPNNARYKDWGGRGIEFRFDSFEAFYAEVGPKPSPDLLLDRINNDGHYEVGNLRWATITQSNRNKRGVHAKA